MKWTEDKTKLKQTDKKTKMESAHEELQRKNTSSSKIGRNVQQCREKL